MLQRSSSLYKGYIYSTQKQEVSFRQTRWRWVVLILACLLIFGEAYSFDNPQALETQIEEDMHVEPVEFNLLYSVYSFPNIIIPLFGGLIIDYLGVRVGVFLFSSILILGQLVVFVGGLTYSFWTMIAGRVIFGIGSESLTVSQSSIISFWFRNKELALAIGLNQSLPKLGSALNSFVSPKLYTIGGNSLAVPLLAGAGVCVFSWICGLTLIWMDRESDRREAAIKTQKEQAKVEMAKNAASSGENKKAPLLESYQGNSSNKNKSNDSNGSGHPEHSGENSLAGAEKIQFSDIKKLKSNFWVLLTICSLSEALFIPFLDNANKFYQYRFGFDSIQAGNMLVIPYCVAALITPFMGIAIDRFGKRGKFIILTTIMFFITHSLFSFLPSCNDRCLVSVVPLIMLGLCFSMYCSVIIPSVPIVVTEARILGTAFGLMGIFQNTALAIFPIIAGAIFEMYAHTDLAAKQVGFQYCALFFVGISVLCFFVACLEEYLDSKQGHRLDKVHTKTKNMGRKFSWDPHKLNKRSSL